ncbi:Glycosyl hydrolases 36 [Sesbania bispinosa]|nr:Glycosyl hydrolases 36 [Sesbania bispinosa]
MTINSVPSIRDECLTVRGKAILTHVPSNIIITPISSEGAFLGATSLTSSSCHAFCLGVLKGFRLTCLFRFKIWWMIPGYGESGRDVPTETQMLLLEARDETIIQEKFCEPTKEGTFYILLLPVLDGQFRTSLQGTIIDELEFCVESGDPNVETMKVTEAVYVNSGDNPFKLIRNSMKILEKHKGTFRHIDNKELPAHVDWFGWNTWDAFYTNVSAQGIDEGLKRFSAGGCLPKWVCIDDGWQNTTQENSELPLEKAKFGSRLQNLKENAKFRGSGKGYADLYQFIRTIKQKYGLKYVYAWHALLGYWSGVDPTSDEMRKYNPKIVSVVQSPGNLSHVVCDVVQCIEKGGVGLIDPLKINEFYDDLHGYLARCGVDGVKVDVQCILDTLGSGYGGRVTLTKRFQEALEDSVLKNFGGNNLICSMSTNNDYIFSSKRSAAARASEDFMPNEPTFQTLHVAAVAFNSLLLGEIVVPDWDMFYSTHYTAEFHAAARALGGCPVYVRSAIDKPGHHDVNIIRKLVLPDGSILRAKHAGRPTRDCLFDDPVMDGKSLLKIWNLNKLCGIVGIFNCQRAGKWPPTPGAIFLSGPALESLTITGSISAVDVDSLHEVAGKLTKLPKGRIIEVSLGVLKCEVFTISPIRVFGPRLEFAPIGLLDMFNSGGALTEGLKSYRNQTGHVVEIQVRGCGRFGAYSNTKPSYCLMDKVEVDFTYHASNGLLSCELLGDCKVRGVEVVYQDFDVTCSEDFSVSSISL